MFVMADDCNVTIIRRAVVYSMQVGYNVTCSVLRSNYISRDLECECPREAIDSPNLARCNFKFCFLLAFYNHEYYSRRELDDQQPSAE